MDSFQLKFQKQRLCASKRLRSINRFLHEHELAEDVINDTKMCVGIIFIWLHDLSTSISHSRWLTDASLAY